MVKKFIIPAGDLHKLLICDAEVGRLHWLERTPDMFLDGFQTAEHRMSAWNSKYAYKEALCSTSTCGYRVGAIWGRQYKAHRVIWAMARGYWPNQIDHINHNRSDNRIVNLRSVTQQENGRNQSLASDNTSGRVGVRWFKAAKKWRAQIVVDGEGKWLGDFDDIKEAISARKEAEKKYGFHNNHGMA